MAYRTIKKRLTPYAIFAVAAAYGCRPIKDSATIKDWMRPTTRSVSKPGHARDAVRIARKQSNSAPLQEFPVEFEMVAHGSSTSGRKDPAVLRIPLVY